MPADLTIFGANYLVFIDAVLAVLVIAWLIYRQPREVVVRWALSTAIMLAVGFVGAQIAGALYSDPRPFVTGHFHPLIPHAADNGFPSDHSLLAAAIVGAVAFARPLWSLPFVILAALVEWARVGAGIHHPIDVLGSDVLIAVGAVLGLLLAPYLTRLLLPYIPAPVLDLVAAPQREPVHRAE